MLGRCTAHKNGRAGESFSWSARRLASKARQRPCAWKPPPRRRDCSGRLPRRSSGVPHPPGRRRRTAESSNRGHFEHHVRGRRHYRRSDIQQEAHELVHPQPMVVIDAHNAPRCNSRQARVVIQGMGTQVGGRRRERRAFRVDSRSRHGRSATVAGDNPTDSNPMRADRTSSGRSAIMIHPSVGTCVRGPNWATSKSL